MYAQIRETELLVVKCSGMTWVLVAKHDSQLAASQPTTRPAPTISQNRKLPVHVI